MDAAQKNVQNKLLAQMSASDFALLQPQLEWTELPVRKLLEGRGRRIEFRSSSPAASQVPWPPIRPAAFDG